MNRFILVLSFLGIFLTAAYSGEQKKPSLIVFISVDQMRADYFERFDHSFSGGLRKLYRQGVFYSNADLNYASSVTCLGHVTLSTGAYPKTSGIIDNEWIDPKTHTKMYCAEDTLAEAVNGEGGGVSPVNVLTTAIGDWLHASSNQSKVFAASGKDRAAIMMGGKHPNGVFWYDRKTGRMVSSSYYGKQTPSWVRSFNDSDWIGRHLPAAWEKILPDSFYTVLGPDDFSAEYHWGGSSSFPHKFSPAKKHEQALTSPYVDFLLIDFALRAVEEEKLGQRGVPDLLCLSFSDLDFIGHAFGPNSHETFDQLIRLDGALGSLFDKLHTIVGGQNLLIVLSADHGVLPLPEYLQQFSKTAARRIMYQTGVKAKIDSLNEAVKNEWGMGSPLFTQNGFLNYTGALAVGKDSLAVESKVRSAVHAIDGLEEIYFRRELAGTGNSQMPYLEKFRRSFYSPRGEDYQVRFSENAIVTSGTTGTSHGSVYSYDTHVPITFWAPGIRPEKVTRKVFTVDIAPTLAKILEIPYPSSVDGRPLEDLVRQFSK
jgi:predicted AlkP superfamily pyrophosphatase or phosphodiesterase